VSLGFSGKRRGGAVRKRDKDKRPQKQKKGMGEGNPYKHGGEGRKGKWDVDKFPMA